MGKLFYVMGKSASGKDTVYNELIKKSKLGLETVTLYTTRPIRADEKTGETYHFVDEVTFEDFLNQGKVIEHRVYNTVHGKWVYFTLDDGQINIADKKKAYLMIGTLESYENTAKYFGNENLIPLYIEVEAGQRLQRAINREKMQKSPKYKELCRRFLADEEDFSEEKIKNCKIVRRYQNENIDVCVADIEKDIRNCINNMI
jgi:Guanylate kinase